METAKERKLFEITQYLITISNRLTGKMPFGVEKELHFISQDVENALNHIGTKQSRYFAKRLKDASLQDNQKKDIENIWKIKL